MKIAYNPKTAVALTAAPSNNDITFDLPGLSIYVKGVKFDGKAYSIFKKYTSATAGGYNGLVPAPSYNDGSTNRFLKEDGTWGVPEGVGFTIVSSTASGLAPKIGTAAASTVTTQADEWVLTSTKGATPTWRKLPTNAFLNYYRPILVNGTSLLGNNNTALNIAAGTNINLTTDTGKVTINNGLTKVSQLTNDSGYLTSDSLNNYVTIDTNLTITGIKTFSNDATQTLILKGTATYSTLKFQTPNYVRTFGINKDGNLFVTPSNNWNAEYLIWHSGNDGHESGLDADTLDGKHLSSLFLNRQWVSQNGVSDANQSLLGVYYFGGRGTNVPSTAGSLLAFNAEPGDYLGALLFSTSQNSLLYRNHWNSKWSNWKTVAFTDSNITGNAASADKLKTKRKLWGLDFDGSADVNGTITFSGGLTNNKSIQFLGGEFFDRYGNFYLDGTDEAFNSFNISKTNTDGTYTLLFTLRENKEASFYGTLTAPTFTGSLKGTADKSKILSNYYSSRQTTIKPGITGDGSMIQYKCTSTCTDTDEPGDGHILHFNWDNKGGLDSLLYIAGDSPATMKVRGMSLGVWGDWATVLTGSNYTSVLDGNYVKAYKTLTNTYNIDDDWGLSVVTFDPKALGTYPSSCNSTNFTLLNLGNTFNRRKQFGFDWYTDSIFYRRHVDSAWKPWVTLLHSSNYTDYVNSTNFPGLAGVRSVTINGDYLRVNTNGTNADLTIPYATRSRILKSQRFDSNDPKPNTSHVGASLLFSFINSAWYNVLTMKSYNDNNYTAALLATPAGNPESDTGYSGNMQWRLGRNSTWLDWKTVLDSSNYSSILDSRYYTETEVNNKLAGYLPLAGGTMSSGTAQIQRAGSSTLWYLGRTNAMIRINSYSGYNAIASMKTTNGDWSLGVHSNNVLYFTYITDTNFNAGTNTVTALVYINASGNVYATHFYEHSDINLKTNIKPILTSDNIPLLKSFDWKSDGSHSYGLIALELEELGYSELVSDEGGLKTVKYSAALSLIVGKLQVKIKELEKEIENLKNKN